MHAESEAKKKFDKFWMFTSEFFSKLGLSIKASETWFSTSLFAYGKVLFYNGRPLRGFAVREPFSIDSEPLRAVLKEIVTQQLAGSLVSAPAFYKALNCVILLSKVNRMAFFHNLADAVEVLLTSTAVGSNWRHVAGSREKILQYAAVRKDSRFCKSFGNLKVYRPFGTWVVITKSAGHKTVFILDNASLEQLRQCCRFYAGFEFYSVNYRISGGNNCGSRSAAFDRLVRWIKDALAYCFTENINPALIARHAKIDVGELTTILFDHKDLRELGGRERFQDQYKDAADALPGRCTKCLSVQCRLTCPNATRIILPQITLFIYLSPSL
ncbi:unnamed protein product [Heligmosomoides polygyrus]|uniref:RdRp catalytic domain-containing protein n=1 Tax=Heligmosomoides polygyrus TaxID=6339 RepID=A0A3P8ABM8_HELPZ|nr:unnamed protein product [Heligmosomoides polygyrus]